MMAFLAIILAAIAALSNAFGDNPAPDGVFLILMAIWFTIFIRWMDET